MICKSSKDFLIHVILSPEYHSQGGYLTVESQPNPRPIAELFVKAGKYLGYSENDPNGPTQSGFSIPQGTTRHGSRCSTSKAFLRPIRDRENLHIVTFAYVTKILFNEDKKAVGVQFDRFGGTDVVFANREIILSAGSINSPQLLMLSGVGPRDHLESLGLPVLADLPVGDNLQDHIYPGGVHFTINNASSIVQRRIINFDNILEYFTNGTGRFVIIEYVN